MKLPHPLLLLVFVFIVDVPFSWCDITRARKQARDGTAQELTPFDRRAKKIAQYASEKAHVTLHAIEEAYYKVHTHSLPRKLYTVKYAVNVFYDIYSSIYHVLSFNKLTLT